MRRLLTSTSTASVEEPNNLAAIGSLTGYRALRWGRNVELIVTDQRSYRSEEPLDRSEAQAFSSDDFPGIHPGGGDGNPRCRAHLQRRPTASVDSFRRRRDCRTSARNEPPQTILGAEQKSVVSRSAAAVQSDLEDLGQHHRHARYARRSAKPAAGADKALARRGLCRLRHVEITAMPMSSAARSMISSATTASPDLPRSPETATASGPGWPRSRCRRNRSSRSALPLSPARSPLPEWSKLSSTACRRIIRCDRCMLARAERLRPQPTLNLLLRHGVRSCLEYAQSGDIAKARAVSNPDLSPHLSFVDMGGHGYAVVRVTSDAFETEFVCIPRPIERSDRQDGGPLAYRAKSHTALWRKAKHRSSRCRLSKAIRSFRCDALTLEANLVMMI